MEQKVIFIIADILGIEAEKIGLDCDLIELGMDSVQFVKIIVELEIQFNMEFEDDDLISTKLNTVRKMIRRLSSE